VNKYSIGYSIGDYYSLLFIHTNTNNYFSNVSNRVCCCLYYRFNFRLLSLIVKVSSNYVVVYCRFLKNVLEGIDKNDKIDFN
jgi:hypothetical protein